MKRFLLALLLVSVVPNVRACSCNIGNVAKKFAAHASIFRGKVTDLVFYDARDGMGDQYIGVTFEITKQWKGKPDQNELLTVYNTISCFGYQFEQGETYLVYAFVQDDHLNAWWCGGVLSEKISKDRFDSESRQLDRLERK